MKKPTKKKSKKQIVYANTPECPKCGLSRSSFEDTGICYNPECRHKITQEELDKQRDGF